MPNMTDIDYVKGLKANMHLVFDSPQGKEVLRYLEMTCCWYNPAFIPNNPDMTMINDGKRQVLATIKSILDLNADQIVSLAQRQENRVTDAF